MFNTIYTCWYQKCNKHRIGNISISCAELAGQDKTRQAPQAEQVTTGQVRSGHLRSQPFRSQWLLFPCRWLLFPCRRQSCCITCNCNTLNLRHDKTRQDKPPQAKQVQQVGSGQARSKRDVSSRTSQVRSGIYTAHR